MLVGKLETICLRYSLVPWIVPKELWCNYINTPKGGVYLEYLYSVIEIKSNHLNICRLYIKEKC